MKINIENLKFETYPFRTPFKFGSSVISELVVPELSLRLIHQDKEGRGQGVIPLGNAWSFPSVPYSDSMNFMKKLVEKLVNKLDGMELDRSILDFSQSLQEIAIKESDSIAREIPGLNQKVPKLSILNCFSLFDIALFDGFGKFYHSNLFDLMRQRPEGTCLEPWLGQNYRKFGLNHVILPRPVSSLAVYHVIGGLDPLREKDINNPVNDGYPESLEDWIQKEQLTHFKIKMRGDNPDWDYQRLVDIDTTCTQKVTGEPVYSLDFNEKCPSGLVLLELCQRLMKEKPEIFNRIEFIEQPTSRDLIYRPEDDLKEIARLKPVVMDESLVDYQAYLKARESGYNGIALKACKGIGFSLLMAAVARKENFFLTVMDLTCPGISFLTSASLAGWLGVSGIEANARQFCPKANETIARLKPEIFQIKKGMIQTDILTGMGLS